MAGTGTVRHGGAWTLSDRTVLDRGGRWGPLGDRPDRRVLTHGGSPFHRRMMMDGARRAGCALGCGTVLIAWAGLALALVLIGL